MRSVLLLIDLQRDYLGAGNLQPEPGRLGARAAALLEGCRQRLVPIVHVWTTVERGHDRRLPHWRQAGRWWCVAGTAGHESPSELRPLAGELIVHKSGFNAFADSKLAAALGSLACERAIIAGVHLHACVRTAAVECLERGLEVQIAEDATGSNDPIHAAATRRWLDARCVRFDSTRAILAGLDHPDAACWAHRSPRVTAQVLFEVPRAGPPEVRAAAAAAREAWPSWRRTAASSRQQILDRAADGLVAVAPELALQMALEIGKPVAHGREEVLRAAANLRDVARRAAEFAWVVREGDGAVHYQPLGVVGLVSPWNNPVAIALGKIGPALVYGNTVVWKPAPAATAISRTLLKLLSDAGLPDGPVQLVTGDHTTAQALAANEDVAAVTLTGSAHAGYALGEICAARLLPFQAELSGNNAAIVWHDADIARAAARIAWGALGFAGQRCTANRRVIVSPEQHDELLRQLERAAQALPWGDPLDASTEIGPVIAAAKREEHDDLIARAQAEGMAGAMRFTHASAAQSAGFEAGSYARPVIVCCDQPGHALVQEETMSPLMVVQQASNFDQAIELCHGVRHGLAAALFSSSRDYQEEFLARARVGIVKINATTAGVDVRLPFGGWKCSGLGPPEHGEADRLFYTRGQAVYGLDRGPEL